MISSRFVVLRSPQRNTAKPQPKHVPHTLAMNLLSFDVAQEKKEDEALIAGFFCFVFWGDFFGFFIYLLNRRWQRQAKWPLFSHDMQKRLDQPAAPTLCLLEHKTRGERPRWTKSCRPL